MADEKKSRQRLTMTAMFHAISDIAKTIWPDAGQLSFRQEYLPAEDGVWMYHCQIWKWLDRADKKDAFVTGAASSEGIEEATAALLAQMKEKFEEKKKELLRDFDSVLDRHHGALRGARSKIREKKA